MANLTGHVSHYTVEGAAERAARRVKGVHAIAKIDPGKSETSGGNWSVRSRVGHVGGEMDDDPRQARVETIVNAFFQTICGRLARKTSRRVARRNGPGFGLSAASLVADAGECLVGRR